MLAPDGVLAVMVGTSFLPDVFRELDGYRPYRWTMAVVGTRLQSIHVRRASTLWKPVLIYGSGPRISGDIVHYESSEHVKHHEHGQDTAIFRGANRTSDGARFARRRSVLWFGHDASRSSTHGQTFHRLRHRPCEREYRTREAHHLGVVGLYIYSSDAGRRRWIRAFLDHKDLTEYRTDK